MIVPTLSNSKIQIISYKDISIPFQNSAKAALKYAMFSPTGQQGDNPLFFTSNTHGAAFKKWVIN